MDRTSCKNGSWNGKLRKYLRVNRREEEWEDLHWDGLEDIEKDQREMKVKRWRQNAGDREKWTSVIKEAKALRRP
jgi:hypothetical protein